MCGPAPCTKPDCTWSEKHRAECEAREVLGWEKARRLAYYGQVKAKRGEAAMQRLVDEVKRQWQAR